MTIETISSNPVRFKPLFPMQVVMIVSATIVIIALVVWVNSPEDLWAALLLLALTIPIFYFASWTNNQTSLELSDQGITCLGPGFCIHSSWDNLSGCAKRDLNRQAVDVLTLRQPGIEYNNSGGGVFALLSFISGQPPLSEQLKTNEGIIPVGLFAKNWRESELGALIQQHAPEAYATLTESQ